MAGNPPCMFHEDRGAVFTGTFFETGQSIIVCPECFVNFAATTLEGLTGVPVPELIAIGEGVLETETPEGPTELTDEDGPTLGEPSEAGTADDLEDADSSPLAN